MTSQSCGAKEIGGNSLQEIEFLWEEYKYRHDLCWKVIIQTTAAFVVLSVIPYVQTEVVRGLGRSILAVPVLALIVVAFSFAVMLNEFDAFDKIKRKYRERQKEVLKIDHEDGKTQFKTLVLLYLFGLFLIGGSNLYSVIAFWIPYVIATC